MSTEEKAEYFIECCVDGYMVKLKLEATTASLQWFRSHHDARTFKNLLQAGVAPWTGYQLVMGETPGVKDHPTYPPHEKTYKERFGS